jgi:DNA polymerase III epsilon subunit-like protein
MTSSDNKNAGKPWTKHEDEQLIQLYDVDKLDVVSIAKMHERAPGGIISRLVKNQMVPDKKSVRGYESYLKLENSKPSLSAGEKPPKLNKFIYSTTPKCPESKDEIITIDGIEYILSNDKVYEIKKIKGLIYGQYDDKTSTVKPLKHHIRKIINYLTSRGDHLEPILWAGVRTDLITVKQYFPNLLFQHIDDLTDVNPIEFSVCISSNYIGQNKTTDEMLIDVITDKIEFIGNLVGPNANILIFDNINLHQDLVPVCIQSNFKIIESDPAISTKSNYIFAIKKPTIEKQGIMVLDTETTGFPCGRDPKEWEKFNSARLIELGYIIYDATGKKIKEFDSLVKPDNWTITNTFIHGITQADANTNGKTITEIMGELSTDLDQVNAFVCHNINFDMDIIMAEAYRANNVVLADKIISKKKICTMELGKKFMKLNKKPKLVELYKFLFNQEFKQDHRALSDCVACAECFYDMTS